jgi:protein-tyrosine-phosphatase
MKKLLASLYLIAALALATPIFVTGCAGGKGTYDPKTQVYDTNAVADTAIVTAQKTREFALDTFDLFLTVERANQAALAKINPAFHQSAEQIRANGKTWINDLTRLIAAYQSSRTESNKVNLQQAISTIQSALASAQAAISAVPPTPKP